jgi:hypothetical protein
MSEPNQKAKNLLINRDGVKVIRLCLNQGEALPGHATHADVAVNVPHAVIAQEALELIVVHMHLAQQQAEVSCGIDTCHK